MTTTAAPVHVASPGIDDRIYDITFIGGNDTTTAIAHGLPFTPTFYAFEFKTAPATYANLAVAVTATTFTVTQSNGVACVVRLFLGRFPNPQNER